mmetsp:Transcript_8249/g.12276  ORF Transcript_8249/g.12276 Transcript_8249/m.12276 type:complete len:84 (-) Transcript_8249:905-1156(-)
MVRVTNHVAILFSMTSEVLSAGVSSSTNDHRVRYCIPFLIIEDQIFEYYISKRIELLATEIYINVGYAQVVNIETWQQVSLYI